MAKISSNSLCSISVSNKSESRYQIACISINNRAYKALVRGPVSIYTFAKHLMKTGRVNDEEYREIIRVLDREVQSQINGKASNVYTVEVAIDEDRVRKLAEQIKNVGRTGECSDADFKRVCHQVHGYFRDPKPLNFAASNMWHVSPDHSIHIRDMEASHILSCIGYVRRMAALNAIVAQESDDCVNPTQAYLDQRVDPPIIECLEKELLRRQSSAKAKRQKVDLVQDDSGQMWLQFNQPAAIPVTVVSDGNTVDGTRIVSIVSDDIKVNYQTKTY